MAYHYFENFSRLKNVIYAVAGGIMCLGSLPHIVPVWLQEGCEQKDQNAPDDLQHHVHRIAAAMHIAQPHRIDVFINKGFSSISAGNTVLPAGAVVGLPRLVLFQTENDVKSSGLKISEDPVDWESHDSHVLIPLLLPSANQINFSIAHELAHIQHLDFVTRSLLAPLSLIASYHLACVLPQFIYPRNPSAMIPLILAVGLIVYSHIHYSLCHWQEYRADRRAALCGRGYTEGGIEMMKKRIALDQKLGVKSKSPGYHTHPSYEDRLEQLEKIHQKQINN